MQKKDLLKKQELAEELGMKFEEISELFSEETLDTMKMANIVGGEGDIVKNCEGGNCGNCAPGCDKSSKGTKCNNKIKNCEKASCPVETKPVVKPSCPEIGVEPTKSPEETESSPSPEEGDTIPPLVTT